MEFSDQKFWGSKNGNKDNSFEKGIIPNDNKENKVSNINLNKNQKSKIASIFEIKNSSKIN